MRIGGDLGARYTYFQTRYDRAGRRGFAGVQKYTSAIRQLAYGVNSDFLDEYLQMSEQTSREACLKFCIDLHRMYYVHEQLLRFPGMIGSIDCMHWSWEMCPAAWRGTYTSGHVGRPSLILQAVASNDLWIWNAYFGQQGSHNHINVFEASPLLKEIINGLAPNVPFSANGNHYEKGYYLGDDIYLVYATFVKTFSDPIDEKRRLFKKKQERRQSRVPRLQRSRTEPKSRLLESPNSNGSSDPKSAYRQKHPQHANGKMVNHLWANTPHDFEPPADPFVDLRDYVSTDDDDSD
uniref:uncharacterized protein LOC122604494 n=1 Tax=Erigeron canadensis TaxID=72917 RepID=UPI001CB97A79|nr:uncharacterized protein LOC122604494 [Erigeron canadensis]